MALTKIRGNTQIIDGSILDAQIAASAGIQTSKLADGANFFQRNGSVVATGDFNLGTFKITNLGAPTADSDAATKGYVDGVASGLDFKNSVRAATTGNITLSGEQTIDGVSLVAGDRVLVKNQTTATQNGIYVVSTGAWSRSTDADNSPTNEVSGGLFCFVEEGTTQADTGWVLYSPNGLAVLGTDDLLFSQFSAAENYTFANVGTGDGQVYKELVSGEVRFRTLVDSSQINVVQSTNTIEFSIIAGSITNTEIATGANIARNKLASGTANRVVVNDGSGVLDVSAVTTTELGYLTGVTSAIQTQLDARVEESKFIVREVPSGLINGTNVTFTLANTPLSGKESVYLNGVLQNVGGSNDYTISGDTITFNTAPTTGDILLVSYIY